MSAISSKKPYRIGRSSTGLGLFATKPIKKGTKIVRYFGPLLDCKKKKDDAVENKYLFELNNRWNIEPGEEINYDYGTDYFKAYLKPIGCRCAACEKKRKKKRAEARAERLRLKAKAERKALRKAEKLAAKAEEKHGLNGAKANGTKLNGVKLSGKHFNGHGGKAAADKAIVMKSRISAKPKEKQGREDSASA